MNEELAKKGYLRLANANIEGMTRIQVDKKFGPFPSMTQATVYLTDGEIDRERVTYLFKNPVTQGYVIVRFYNGEPEEVRFAAKGQHIKAEEYLCELTNRKFDRQEYLRIKKTHENINRVAKERYREMFLSTLLPKMAEEYSNKENRFAKTLPA